MSKNFDQISTQVACVQTQNRTLAFYLKITGAPLERFHEIIEGKVKLLLKDFSAGKGDMALNPYYNLDLCDVFYLYHHARNFHMPTPFQGQKIFGNAVETEGRYKGLSKCFHITIARNDKRKNASGELEPAKQPWNIAIENGYAVAAPGKNKGTYYEKSGTFKVTESSYINLTDKDFLMCMESIYKCIDLYRELYGRTLIPKGLKEIAERDRRNQYDDSNNGEKSEEDQASRPTENSNPQTSGSTGVQQAVHTTPILIDSDFVALENGAAAAVCMVRGKRYRIIFDQITDDVLNAKINRILVNGELYADTQGVCHCAKLAND